MEINFERTHDKRFIRQCMTDPAVWRMTANDSMSKLNPGLFFVSEKWPFYYLKVNPDYGLIIGEPRDHGIYEAHVALLPKARGMALDICKSAIEWFFENEECHTIRAAIPSFNHPSLRIARMSGLISTGTRHGAFLKDGKAYDLHLFELRR